MIELFTLKNIYKKKYNQFLKGERFIIDNVTGEKLYLWESEFWNCNVQLYTYYFFDMDGDENPELCIKDEVNTLYIIKYEEGHPVTCCHQSLQCL